MRKNDADGFTLIELMITVAIMALLASIALPAYQEQVRRGHRAEAKALLLENAQWVERHFTAQNTYVGATISKTQAPENGSARYNISFAASQPTATSYVIQAAPTGSMSSDACGTFTLDNLGRQNLVDATKTIPECWGK